MPRPDRSRPERMDCTALKPTVEHSTAPRPRTIRPIDIWLPHGGCAPPNEHAPVRLDLGAADSLFLGRTARVESPKDTFGSTGADSGP